MKNIIGAFINAYIHYDIEKGFRGISSAGFNYVDLLVTPGLSKGMLPKPKRIYKESIAKIINLKKKYNLNISGLYYYKGGKKLFRKDKIVKEFVNLIDIAGRIDTKYLITDTDEVKDKFDESDFYNYINIISDLAANKGLQLCIDIHGDWFSSGRRAYDILKRINNSNTFINYCTGNVYYYSGEDPVKDILYALPYLKRIHLKDSSGIYHDYNFPALGEGKVDFKKILNTVKDLSIDLIAEIELKGKKVDISSIDEAFKKTYYYLNKLLRNL